MVRGRKKDENPYKCKECNQSFSETGGLIMHMKTHTVINVFDCSLCDKAFSGSASFEIHVRTHTRDKPYKCIYCNKNFSQKPHLDRHIRSHTGDKPYQCSHCDKTFSRKCHLSSHTKLHTGEKPYQCSQCNKAYTQKATLIEHISTQHTGEKPYECDQCNKTFYKKSYLFKHIRSNTQLWKCMECGKQFTQLCGRNAHMKIHAKVQNGESLTDKRIHTVVNPHNLIGNNDQMIYNFSIEIPLSNYLYPLCNYSTSDRNSFKKHLEDNIGQNKVRCSIPLSNEYQEMEHTKRSNAISENTGVIISNQNPGYSVKEEELYDIEIKEEDIGIIS